MFYLNYHSSLSGRALTLYLLSVKIGTLDVLNLQRLQSLIGGIALAENKIACIFLAVKTHIFTVLDMFLHSSSASMLCKLPSDLSRLDLGRFGAVVG